MRPPSPPRALIDLWSISSRRTYRLESSIPKSGVEQFVRRHECAEGTDEKDDVHGIGAYFGRNGIAGRWIARNERTSEPTDDGLRGRGTCRLPRRDSAAR